MKSQRGERFACRASQAAKAKPSGVRRSNFSELRIAPFPRLSPISRERGLGLESRLNEFCQLSEVGRAPNLIGVVVVSPRNDVEEFG